ncbi:MAG: FkbM family methyltransferase [Candidatus Aminicenantales bacterium]
MSAVQQSQARLRMLLFIFGAVIGLAAGRFMFFKSEPATQANIEKPGLKTELDLYRPKHFSEGNEEVVIRHYFKDRKGGFFVDVGSYHYRDRSNTYYLEKRLGWRGIAVDANGEFVQGYKNHRPGTQFFNFFVSNKSDEKAELYIVRDPGQLTRSTGDPALVRESITEIVQVPTVTLDDLLSSLKITRIDFINMDIELAEPQALAGFDIEKYRPELVCIEAHPPVRAPILAYFKDHGYIRLDQYVFFDQKNWYFIPESRYATIFDVDF